MKNLSSLTTFFVVFLFIVYLGVFSGFQIKGFIADKRIIIADTKPVESADVPVVLLEPSPSPKVSSAILAQKTSVPYAVPSASVRPAGSAAGAPAAPQSAAPVPVSTSAPPVSVPEPTLPPAAPPPPPPPPPPAPPQPPLPPPPPPPPPPPSEPPPSNRCIIALSGSQYDITEYRNLHSGGDVFQCGTDMTASFLSRHPASFLQKMSRYKI